MAKTMTRGQKAAATRAKNKAARDQAAAREALLNATENHRGLPLREWATIIENLEWLSSSSVVGTLTEAMLVFDVQGTAIRAHWDGEDWVLLALPKINEVEILL